MCSEMINSMYGPCYVYNCKQEIEYMEAELARLNVLFYNMAGYMILHRDMRTKHPNMYCVRFVSINKRSYTTEMYGRITCEALKKMLWCELDTRFII